MAEIKMDISEYEAMQENKRLLQESIDKQAELYLKVETLQKEKLDALQKTGKQIVKTVHTYTHEKVVVKPEGKELLRQLMFRELTPIACMDIEDLNFASFFGVEVLSSKPKTEVEVIELNEAKREIRNTLKKEMDEEIFDKLSRLSTLEEHTDALEKEIKRLKKEISNYKSRNEAQVKVIVSQRESIEKLQTENETMSNELSFVKEILATEEKWWNARIILNKLKTKLGVQ